MVDKKRIQWSWLHTIVLMLLPLLAGCRLIMVGCAVPLALVGLGGYAVYKTGDAVVTGTGKAAQATGEMFASGTKSMATVAYANGDFTTHYPAEIQTVWQAADQALRMAGFKNIQGSSDALSGEMVARTHENKETTLSFQALSISSTEVRIRIGIKGDLQASEIIHEMILRQLSLMEEEQ